MYNFYIQFRFTRKDVTQAIISSFADGLLQSLEAGGEEIFSTLRNDEILER